ncbi:hypothetical protein [Streptomyces sp. NPDC086777]|uniref:hypothetical protein n=1 Tax=Streptomyces sp. NPDC086777 TaxID=3154866 RepID=UPI00344D8C04
MARQTSRRNMSEASGTAAGIAAVGAAAPAAAAGTAAGTEAGTGAGTFAHPGLLHTRTGRDRMAAKVKAGTAPYAAGFARLTANRHARSGRQARPQAVVFRGSGTPENYSLLYNDIHAGWAAATGVRAPAGGLLLPRRRGRGRGAGMARGGSKAPGAGRDGQGRPGTVRDAGGGPGAPGGPGAVRWPLARAPEW